MACHCLEVLLRKLMRVDVDQHFLPPAVLPIECRRTTHLSVVVATCENILDACLQCLQLLRATNLHSALLPRFVGGACAEVVNGCTSTTPPADAIYPIDI